MLSRSLSALFRLTVVFGALAAAGAASASVTAPQPARAVPGPMIRVPGVHGVPRDQAESSNWSGYAANGSTYSSVSANWTQPTVHCTTGEPVLGVLGGPGRVFQQLGRADRE